MCPTAAVQFARIFSINKAILTQNTSLNSILTMPYAQQRKNNLSITEHHVLQKRTPVNDIVSKNITQVLENLLKDYESSQLPSHGKGK